MATVAITWSLSMLSKKVNFTGSKWSDKLLPMAHGAIPRWSEATQGPRHVDWSADRRKILRKAILGMLSRTRLRHGYIQPRLKIYAGPKHPHSAQAPRLRRAHSQNIRGKVSAQFSFSASESGRRIQNRAKRPWRDRIFQRTRERHPGTCFPPLLIIPVLLSRNVLKLGPDARLLITILQIEADKL
jgi:hypothetical protein